MALGDTGGVWVQTADDAPPEDVMREADNVGPVREILKQPFWGHYRDDAGRTSNVHNIQYFCERGHTPLGYSGDGRVRSPGGIFQGNPDPICFVLSGCRDPVLPNSGQAPGGTRRADGSV